MLMYNVMMEILLILYTSPYHIYKTVLIAKTNKSEPVSQSIPGGRQPDRKSEYRERKPTSKGLLARVKCQQRNARTSAILSVFPKPRDSVSLQKSCYVAGSITSQSFPDFLNLSETARRKSSSPSAITLPSTRSSVKRH